MKTESPKLFFTNATGYPRQYLGHFGKTEPDIWLIFGKKITDEKKFVQQFIKETIR
jgi:hypothetical protein